MHALHVAPLGCEDWTIRQETIQVFNMSGDSKTMESCSTSNNKEFVRAQKSGRSFAIHCRAQNLHILKVQLHIIDLSDGQTCCVQFPFDLHGDTPMDVADELKSNAPKLNLSHQDVATITTMITKEIFKALQCGGFNGRGAHKSSVTPQQQVAPPQKLQQQECSRGEELMKPRLEEQVAHGKRHSVSPWPRYSVNNKKLWLRSCSNQRWNQLTALEVLNQAALYF